MFPCTGFIVDNTNLLPPLQIFVNVCVFFFLNVTEEMHPELFMDISAKTITSHYRQSLKTLNVLCFLILSFYLQVED